MNGVSPIFKIFNLILIWIGVVFVLRGLDIMRTSNYRPPATPIGWVLGMVWVGVGALIACNWLLFISAAQIDQIISKRPRWTRTKMFSSGLVLLGGAVFAVIGTFSTWKHPFLLTPCDCLDTQFGKTCQDCLCGVHGRCSAGMNGNGQCLCEEGWAGRNCTQCAPHFKPVGQCDTCLLGFKDNPDVANGRCSLCARGYASVDEMSDETCDTCAMGWQPWTHNSTLFPAIVDEDGRHICDECLDNYWGYNCKPCTFGNDVPKITLQRNSPLNNQTRVQHTTKDGVKIGTIFAMQNKLNPTWQYDPKSWTIRDDLQVQIRYDVSNDISEFVPLSQIQGIQCGNRGICRDDNRHQALNPTWDNTCTTKGTPRFCSSDSECTISENCKGVCIDTQQGAPTSWIATVKGSICRTDDDCHGNNFKGGQCVEQVCCDETRHGNGTCLCNVTNAQEPACDFCPGYDWVTENKNMTCMGHGNCQALNNMNGYGKMVCSCSKTQYISNQIVDMDKKIQWSGELCECGSLLPGIGDTCEQCATGFWGALCNACPGGGGGNACGGMNQGSCDDGITGTGECECTEGESSWALANYVKRFDGDTVHQSLNNNSQVCTECTPNFYGDKCRRCPNTEDIQSRQVSDIFQPGYSYHLGGTQSSAEPKPICHSTKGKQFCTLACSGGGWCDWGRTGKGTCTCWSNKPLADSTWNPFDNVCIGTGEHCLPKDGTCRKNHSKEVCEDKEHGWVGNAAQTKDPARNGYQRCEIGTSGTSDCTKFQKVDWHPGLSSCIKNS